MIELVHLQKRWELAFAFGLNRCKSMLGNGLRDANCRKCRRRVAPQNEAPCIYRFLPQIFPSNTFAP
jgi:hypothetical protein